MAKKNSANNRPPADLENAKSVAAANTGEYPRLRAATTHDLDAINRVIESAIATWDLPQRVKRISLPLYRYQPQDLDLLHMVVLETSANDVAGVASWETECLADPTTGHSTLLLHGIYVDADRQRQGIGSRLLLAAERAAERYGCALLVKAQSGAGDFFRRRGYRKLGVNDPKRDYPHRYWKPPTSP